MCRHGARESLSVYADVSNLPREDARSMLVSRVPIGLLENDVYIKPFWLFSCDAGQVQDLRHSFTITLCPVTKLGGSTCAIAHFTFSESRAFLPNKESLLFGSIFSSRIFDLGLLAKVLVKMKVAWLGAIPISRGDTRI